MNLCIPKWLLLLLYTVAMWWTGVYDDTVDEEYKYNVLYILNSPGEIFCISILDYQIWGC